MAELDTEILSVSELNRKIRLTIEKNLLSCWIRGEISNLTKAASGHWYFSLKDATASAKCVMFKARNQFVEWSLREGEEIELRAQASFYEPRGEFQLVVDAMRKTGQGTLFEAFLRLKARLQAEGVFDPDRKKMIPLFPRRIGIVTSKAAAALSDALFVLRNRWPVAQVIVYPCLVQGNDAAAQIAMQLDSANTHSYAEVVLLIRGGGSLEDLWAFNEEKVARAIASSRLPVITGVGHETDFTIADFVADLRAPTPTAAAQACTPDRLEILLDIQKTHRVMAKSMQTGIASKWQHLDHIQRRLRHPKEQLNQQQHRLVHMTQRLRHGLLKHLERHLSRLNHTYRNLKKQSPDTSLHIQRIAHLKHRLGRGINYKLDMSHGFLRGLTGNIESLNPREVLRRGYSITHTQEGRVIRNENQAPAGETLTITVEEGSLNVCVLTKVA